MQADTGFPSGDADLFQIDRLCDDLSSRVETAREEQVLLGQLVTTTTQTRPYRARQYRVLLNEVSARYHTLVDLLHRYCR